MPTIANEKISFEVKFVQYFLNEINIKKNVLWICSQNIGTILILHKVMAQVQYMVKRSSRTFHFKYSFDINTPYVMYYVMYIKLVR